MYLRFWNDPETGLPHIYDHGVTEDDEVCQVMIGKGLDYPEKGDSRVRLGTTASGRALKVVYFPDKGSLSAFIVTSYDLKGKALKAYRRAKRRKRK